METDTADLESLAYRIQKLEQHNHRLRLFCLMLVAVLVLTLIACVSRPASILEAQKFILRDKNGKERAEIAMDYGFGSKGDPVIRLLDENGKELTTIGAGTIGISGAEGSTTLLADALYFSKPGMGAGVDSASLQGGTLLLSGKNGAVMLDADSPVLEISDSDGFRADLGHNDLKTERTGTKHPSSSIVILGTSAATLVLSDKKGNVVWRTP